MSKFYTKLPGSDVLRSKIDVFTMSNPNDGDVFHRVELIVDNDGVFITSVDGSALENISIEQKDFAIAVARGILEAYEQV